jgi:hypothetical protein
VDAGVGFVGLCLPLVVCAAAGEMKLMTPTSAARAIFRYFIKTLFLMRDEPALENKIDDMKFAPPEQI